MFPPWTGRSVETSSWPPAETVWAAAAELVVGWTLRWWTSSVTVHVRWRCDGVEPLCCRGDRELQWPSLCTLHRGQHWRRYARHQTATKQRSINVTRWTAKRRIMVVFLCYFFKHWGNSTCYLFHQVSLHIQTDDHTCKSIRKRNMPTSWVKKQDILNVDAETNRWVIAVCGAGVGRRCQLQLQLLVVIGLKPWQLYIVWRHRSPVIVVVTRIPEVLAGCQQVSTVLDEWRRSHRQTRPSSLTVVMSVTSRTLLVSLIDAACLSRSIGCRVYSITPNHAITTRLQSATTAVELRHHSVTEV